jgi:ketosteroid isomerase-like protein
MIGALIARSRSPAFYEAMNRRDLERLLAALDDDVTFVYPGDVTASGTHTGKPAIRAWFERFFEQFPWIRFTVKQVAVANLFDMRGNNTVATHWEVDVTNRDGVRGHTSGVTIATLRRAKGRHIQDFIFDTGPRFREVWGETAPNQRRRRWPRALMRPRAAQTAS